MSRLGCRRNRKNRDQGYVRLIREVAQQPDALQAWLSGFKPIHSDDKQIGLAV